MPRLVLQKDILVSPEDYPRLSEHKYYAHRSGYPRRVKWDHDQSKKINHQLHHDVLGKPPAGMIVDHINRDKTDNRRENLRFAPRNLNGQNAKTRGNTPYLGVFYTHSGFFQTKARVEKSKPIHIMCSKNPVICAIAYDNFVQEKYDGPRLNFQTIKARKKALVYFSQNKEELLAQWTKGK